MTIALISNLSFGQNFDDLNKYEFKTTESYQTEKNNVLLCANYLLDNPASEGGDRAELNRLISIKYIIKWMEGTPDYTFDIGEKAVKLTKGNSDLLGLYLAAMSKVVIENKGEKLDGESIYNQSENLLVNYCSNSANNTKPSKKIKKLIKARKKKK